MRKSILLLVLAFCCAWGIHAQAIEDLSYDSVAAKAKKDIRDYFLLCPDIVFFRFTEGDSRGFINVRTPDDPADVPARSFAFRKSLLIPGKKPNGIDVKSVVVDRANAYIHVDAVNWVGRDYPMSLTFVYFDRQDGSRIPALTFHHEEMEEVADSFRFYDLRGAAWRNMTEAEFLPAHSMSDFTSLVRFDASKLTEPASEFLDRVRWVMVLPQFGTTAQLLPSVFSNETDPQETTRLDALNDRLAEYAVRLPWDETAARFKDGGIVMRDGANPPSTAVAAIDCLARFPAWAFDTLSNPLSRADRRKLRETGKSDTARLSLSTPDQVRVTPVEDANPILTEEARVMVLGSAGGEPLVALQQANSEVVDLTLWVCHVKQGTMEQRELLPKLTWQDFFNPGRQVSVTSKPQIDLTLENDEAITARIHTWMNPDFESAQPDFSLSLNWDGSRFVQTKKPL